MWARKRYMASLSFCKWLKLPVPWSNSLILRFFPGQGIVDQPFVEAGRQHELAVGDAMKQLRSAWNQNKALPASPMCALRC